MVSEDWVTISSRVERNTFLELKTRCNLESTTPSLLIRKIVERDLKNPKPINKAGVSKIQYDKLNDSFTWKILYDTGEEFIIDLISHEFIENLVEQINSAKEVRETYLKKNKSNSTPVPESIKKIGGK